MMTIDKNTKHLMAKLERVQCLYDRAATEGERQAAARALCRLVAKILSTHKAGPSISRYEFPEIK